MTGVRITDADGHTWPITGHRCPVCRMPADPVLDGQPHPHCLPTSRVDDTDLAAAVDLLVRALGAEPLGRYTTRWIVSGAALPTSPSPTTTPTRRSS